MLSSLLNYSTARHLSFQDLRRITRRIDPISMLETRPQLSFKLTTCYPLVNPVVPTKDNKKGQLPETQLVVNRNPSPSAILTECDSSNPAMWGQLFAKILFQQMPQGVSNAVNWIQSELLPRHRPERAAPLG
jgi:hypothetical protein